MSIKKADRMANVPMSKTRVIQAQAEKLTSEEKRVINLSIGQPNFPTPEYIKNEAKKALDQNYTGYPPVIGIEPLRKAIAEKLTKTCGVNYGHDEIIVTTGVAQGMFIALMSYLNPGDEIILPNPGYNSYPNISNFAGAVVKTYDLIEENGFQVDIEQLKGLITDKAKMLVLITPNNPVGTILREKTLKEIAEIVLSKDIIVLSDEIYGRLSYDGIKPMSISSIPGMKEKCIILNGFSKYYSMTGWRLGYIAAPKEIMETMSSLCLLTTSGANSFSQYAAVEALNNEEDPSCEEMRLEFKRRRDYLCRELNKVPGISCIKPEGALYIFLNIKNTGLTSEEFVNYLLNEYYIAAVPGTVFGSNGEGYVRLSYTVSFDDIVETAKRIKTAVEKMVKKGAGGNE